MNSRKTKEKKKMISIRLGEAQLEYIKQRSIIEKIPKTEVIENALKLSLEKAKDNNNISNLKGIGKGIYGKSTHEIDNYIKEERDSWV